MKKQLPFAATLFSLAIIQGCSTIMGEQVVKEHELQHNEMKHEYKFDMDAFKKSDNYHDDIKGRSAGFTGTIEDSINEGIGRYMIQNSKLSPMERVSIDGTRYRQGVFYEFNADPANFDEPTLFFVHETRNSDEMERNLLSIQTEYTKEDGYGKVSFTCPEYFQESGKRGGPWDTPRPSTTETAREDFKNLCSNEMDVSLFARIKVEGEVESEYGKEAIKNSLQRNSKEHPEYDAERQIIEYWRDDFTYGLGSGMQSPAPEDIIEPDDFSATENYYTYFIIENKEGGSHIPLAINMSPFRDGTLVEYVAMYHYELKGDGSHTYSESEKNAIHNKVENIINH